MSSRFLIGLGAWLLGAVTATGGSMIAVNVMAHGLLDAQAQQLGGASVTADLEPGSSIPSASPAASVSRAKLTRPSAAKATHSASPSSHTASSGSDRGPWSGSASQDPSGGSSQSPSGGSSQSPPTPSSSQSAAGTLLVSGGGSVMATCESAGAYLLYWSPAQGFVAENVNRGPAAIASVAFQGSPGVYYVMRVSCSSGTPVAQVYHEE